jgi:hypothetical protein
VAQILRKYLCGGGNFTKNLHLVTIYNFFGGKVQNFAKKSGFLGEKADFLGEILRGSRGLGILRSFARA